jgi:hypothetical protein
MHYPLSADGVTASMNCMGFEIEISSQIYLYSSYFGCNDNTRHKMFHQGKLTEGDALGWLTS